MAHTLFPSVDAMLDPTSLSAITSVQITEVRRVPLRAVEAYSGSSFYRIETNEHHGPRFILKCVPAPDTTASPADWVPNAAVRVWQHGILDRLPAHIVHTIVACAYDRGGYALLMDDMSAALFNPNEPFTPADHRQLLDTMAAMHAAFWDDPHLRDPHLGLARPTYMYTDSYGKEGWAFAEQLLAPDVALKVRQLQANPQPLYNALLRYPATLVHNDLWWANLGLVRGQPSRVVVLDWDFVTVAPPAVDLAFYIGENNRLLPDAYETVIATYRDYLAQHIGARFYERQWQEQVDLCLLGCFLRRGTWLLLAAAQTTDAQERIQYTDELAWWSRQIRSAMQWL